MLTSKQQFQFVLAVPLINVIADSTQNYFSTGLTSPGYLRAFILLAFIAIFFKDYFRKNTLNNMIFISLIYYFILGFFSSNIIYSQSIYLKYLIASMMFPVGLYYFRTTDRYKDLINVMIWVLGVYLLVLLISNIFLLGSSDYLDKSTYFGTGRVNITKAMMILVLISPLYFRFERNKVLKRIIAIIVVTAIIFILLGVKRSAVLGLFIGYFVYYILAPQKTRVTKGILIVGLIMLFSSPLYYDTLIKRVEARQEVGRFDLSRAEKEEGRVIELRATLEAYVEGNLAYKLFGAELFNGTEYFKTERMLHTDYATMLAGSGIIGLGFFLLIYYLLFRKFYQFKTTLKHNLTIRDIIAVSISLIVAILITGISGTVTGIGLRGIVFLFWGASISLLNNEFIRMKMNGYPADCCSKIRI